MQPGEGFLVKMNAQDTIQPPQEDFECGTLLYDECDGQYYETVQIGEQCWMAENLNIGERIDGMEDMTDNEVIEKYCYDNVPANCETYGGLYQWDEMMQYTITAGVQGICPAGWHIPTDDEWTTLEGTVDSQYPVGDPEWDAFGSRGFDAGLNLKSISGWNSNGNGTDLYGFSALPGGDRSYNGGFSFQGYRGNWWSSEETYTTNAWYRELGYDDDQSSRNFLTKGYGFSVRCLKGVTNPINQPPDSPSNPQPENGSTSISINTALSWSCTDPENDPITYDVYFGTESTSPQVATGIADTFYTPGTLEYATTYYWKIIAYDDHGNTTEGEVWSFTTINQDNSYSLEFDGVDDYVEFGVLDGFNPDEDLSIEAMFKFNGPNGVSDHQYVFQFAQDGPGSGGIIVKDDNIVQFGVVMGGNTGYSVSGEILPGNWYDVCGTYNSTTGKMRLFINGVVVDSLIAPTTGYYTPNNSASRLGNYHFNSHYFNGNIYSAHISNSILHTEDYVPFQSMSLTEDTFGLWLINEVTGNQVLDASGNENHGIMNGCGWTDNVPF